MADSMVLLCILKEDVTGCVTPACSLHLALGLDVDNPNVYH